MKNLEMNGLMETIKETKVVEKKKAKTKNVEEMMTAYLPHIKKALPQVMTPERFLNIMTTAILKNPALLECTAESLIGAMLTSAQLGLEPNTILGQAYLIPYNRSVLVNGKWEKVREVQFQLGYKGMLNLAQRSAEFKTIQAHTVFYNDFFEYELGLEPKLKHIPAESNRGEIRCFYAMYQLVNGGNGFIVMSKEDIEKHSEKFSASIDKKNSVWKEHFEIMAHKTVLKKLLKFAPIKTDLLRVFEQDNTIKNEIKEDMLMVDPVNIFESPEEVILEEQKEEGGIK